MKFLVTGAKGRIGKCMVNTLLKQGFSVRGIDLVPDESNPKEEGDYEYICGNLLEPGLLPRALDDVDVVVHIAGLILFDEKQYRRIFDANWRTTFELLETMARSKRSYKRFLYASSGQVYPDNPAGAYLYNPIDESHPLRPMNYYGYAKKASEELVWFYQRKSNIPGTCFRFSHTQYPQEIIDPESEWSGPRFYLNRRLKSWKNIENKTREIEVSISRLEAHARDEEQLFISCDDSGRSYQMVISHPQDIVDGMILALKNDSTIGEAYNLGHETPFDFGVMIPYLAKKLGMDYVSINLPIKPSFGITTNTKAKVHFGYSPKYSPYDLIDAA